MYRQLCNQHAALRGMSVQDAKCCFVKLWSTLPLFGLELLSCVNMATREKGIIGVSRRKVRQALNNPHHLLYVCTSHLYTSRNPLLPLLSSALCRSYFCPITERSPCRGTLRTSWHLNRYSACTFCTFNDFCAHADAFCHSFVIIIFTVCTVVRFIHIGSGVHLSSALCLLPVVSGFRYHDTSWPSLLSPTSLTG